MEEPTVLVVSANEEFAAGIVARWQTERSVPAFALASSRGWNGAPPAAFDLAVVGPLADTSDAPLGALEETGKPIVAVCRHAAACQSVRQKMPRVLPLPQYEGWLDALVLLGSECLRRTQALTYARQAEAAATLHQRQATLGRYMLDMRHSFNNALTSVLGNSELLLLEPGSFSPQVREQIETIRNMSLRMHEIMQRFSSLETELRVSEERAGHAAAIGKVLAVAAGS